MVRDGHVKRRTGKGRRSRQAFVGDDTQGVQVAGRAGLVSGDAFRLAM